MKEEYYQTLKSVETEDWLDLHIIRPFCFRLARFLARFDVNPNTVTIWSMVFGVASAYFFSQGCLYYDGMIGLANNLFAIALLIGADILDCTDGQLARMTGKKSRMGRILDGMAGFVWFLPIYHALVWRFYQHHDIEFSWLGINDTPQNVMIVLVLIYVLAWVSGLLGMGSQQRMADYYIQVHLFFLKGDKGSELDNSRRQQEIYDQMPADAPLAERMFQKSYISYTRKQEKATPQFQRLMDKLRDKYGSVEQIPAELREEFHRYSLALMKWNGLLTFNFRESWLFLFCLLDIPVVYFFFEVIVMSLLAKYINYRHEAFSRQIADKL